MSISIDKSYDQVRDYLTQHKSVDMITVGGAPATFRWLTSKNKYINLGLEQQGETSLLKANENSYGVTPEELEEAAQDIRGHFAKK